MQLLISIIISIFSYFTTCSDCGMTNCIYEQINETVRGEGSDLEIESAIYEVCRERNIKDSITIDLLKANYYL